MIRVPLRTACVTASFLLLAARGAWALPTPPDFSALAARLLPTVVSIASTDPVHGSDNSDQGGSQGGDQGGGDGSKFSPHGAFHGPRIKAFKADDSTGSVLPPPKAEEALGSGFVIDPAGYILTNNHVIDGATTVTATFSDGTVLPATIVGRDTAADLALLKVDAGHKLPAVTFGDSTKLKVGDYVMAIGNPYGLPGSVSAGIVSALHRDIGIGKYDDFIQTDAAINRGNSGGPLFDSDGQVIGVDSAIYSPSGGSIGIGFAIPEAMAAPVAASLKQHGSMTRGWIGVDVRETTPQIATALDLPNRKGALVGGVDKNGPANGVLEPGDLITGFGGVPIDGPRALLIRLAQFPAGSRTTVAFFQGADSKTAPIAIVVPPASPAASHAGSPAIGSPVPELGVVVASSTDPLGITVIAVLPGSPAARAGIAPGERIEEINAHAITSADDLRDALSGADQQGPLAVLVGNSSGQQWVPVTIAG